VGTAYSASPFATIPNPCTAEFVHEWVPGILAYRLDELDTTGWTTIQVYQGSGGAASDEVFYAATTAELQAIIDDHAAIHTDGLIVAIEAGTEWQHLSETAVELGRAKICLTRFGTGNNPLFHGTETLAALGVASLGSPASGIYTVTLGASEMTGKTLSHVIEHWGTNPRSILTATPYVWKATAGAVAAEGDFHYASATRVLTIYPRAGATLTAAGFRAITHAGSTFTGSMIRMENHDRVVVKDIDVIGTGGNAAGSGGQVWSFISLAKSTNVHGIINCMGVLNSEHNAGHYNTTSGGICIVAGGQFGLCKHYGSIPIVFYTASGGHEGYTLRNNIIRWVTNEVISTAIERNTQPIYAHTSGGANKSLLTLFANDEVWCGQWGYSSKPLCGDQPLANFDDDMITDARAFVVGTVMDGGNFAARKNTGNLLRIMGQFNGHVYVNCRYKNMAWERTTDTVTIEYLEISTTDYDYRGWEINPIWEINVGATSGNFNFGLLRNNLSGGTEPDRQGVHEGQIWNGTLYFNTPAGLNITGTWNCLSSQQNGTIATATGNLNNGPMRQSWINSLIVNNSAANSTEDLVLGIPEGDPTGSRYVDGSAATARGGCRGVSFKGCRATAADQGGFRNFGTSYFTTNTDCDDMADAYAAPFSIPAFDSEIIQTVEALHTSADGAVVEYDHYGRARNATTSARGAIEAGGGMSDSETRTSVAIGIGVGL
jgi:hypothetical protein